MSLVITGRRRSEGVFREGFNGPLTYKQMKTITILTAACAGFLLITGCATTPGKGNAGANNAAPPAGIVLHRDKDIEGVWLAPGFNFNGYDTLLIEVPVFAGVERSNEAEMRAMAMRVLPDQIAEHVGRKSLFRTVTTRAEDVKPGGKCLKLQSRIIEYEKGGGAARYFAGAFGGGQPVIKVRGQLMDGEQVVCVYEMKRSGESAGSRLGGVFMSDEEIQRNDIRDLASDLSDFFQRTAGLK